ncbi:MAG: serine/threonine protein kinase [Deltaproteobacteria bacterium]|nr:serine/threonine protein kinase [Deltaproteobacteria bacterium]
MNYGRYKVIKELGKGAMGAVYQAHDPNLDILVALKVLRQDRVVDETFARRFLAEAKALGRLEHPNIVRVYNVDEDGGTVYIAMEFIEGEDLSAVMKREQPHPEEIAGIGVAVAEALDYAHGKGIVHRDIKPSNLLLRSDGRLKLTDFGIAHIEDIAGHEKTQAGEVLGTPAYMSPEQVLGKPVDGRADIFSLGVILYELGTGKRPFSGESLGAIFNAITTEEPVSPRERNPGIPEALDRVVMKCLGKSPEERFQTGRGLADALKGCFPGEAAPPPGQTASEKGPGQGKKVTVAVAAVVLAAALGGTFYHYLSGGKGVRDNTAASVPLQAPARRALLKVESTPPGAQVFIDGTFRGNSPVREELPEGKHEVRLTLAGHQEWEAQVQLAPESETPLEVRLMPATGEIK